MGTARNIANLPDQVLIDVSDFLAGPSRVMLAVALTARPSSSLWIEDDAHLRLSAPSAAILGQGEDRWAVLDFALVEESLASQLTDDDLRAMLLCINAKSTLKRLKLAGCVNIVGHGLEALRGSAVMEQLDISIAAYKYSDSFPMPMLSAEVALPIAESVVISSGDVLKIIEHPSFSVWHEDNQALRNFWHTYFGHRRSREVECSGCKRPLSRSYSTCHDCLRHYCSPFRECKVKSCSSCAKERCVDCAPYCEWCHKCSKCNGCPTPTSRCEGDCGRQVCDDCLNTCQNCNRIGCSLCMPIFQCKTEGCGTGYCGSCRLIPFCEVGEYCSTCYKCGGKCQGCGRTACEECIVRCDLCDATSCKSCFGFYACEKEGCMLQCCNICRVLERNVRRCRWCATVYCYECRLYEYDDEKQGRCRGCDELIGRHARQVIDGLRHENERLRRENREIREE